MNNALVRYLMTGFLATLTMDLGSALLRKIRFTAGLPPTLLGRWFAAMARGGFEGRTIVEAPTLPVEVPLGVLGHYLIGISLTTIFVMLLRALPARPTTGTQVLLALGFGLATNLLPWLVMFPSMGFGAFGSRAPAELLLLRTSLVNHCLFGIGLAFSSLWLLA